jgi:hypothetical protein
MTLVKASLIWGHMKEGFAGPIDDFPEAIVDRRPSQRKLHGGHRQRHGTDAAVVAS